MAQDPGIGYRVRATITSIKGECGAGHQVGESFDISCHDPGALCGWFYHDIFPSLCTFQFGGNLPEKAVQQKRCKGRVEIDIQQNETGVSVEQSEGAQCSGHVRVRLRRRKLVKKSG